MTKKTEILETIEKEMLKVREEANRVIEQSKESADKFDSACEASKLSGKADGLLFAYKTIILLTSEDK